VIDFYVQMFRKVRSELSVFRLTVSFKIIFDYHCW